MKRPYLSQFERQLIASDTSFGDRIMVRFRLQQLYKALGKEFPAFGKLASSLARFMQSLFS